MGLRERYELSLSLNEVWGEISAEIKFDTFWVYYTNASGEYNKCWVRVRKSLSVTNNMPIPPLQNLSENNPPKIIQRVSLLLF